MNIPQRIVELNTLIESARQAARKKGKAFVGTPDERHAFGMACADEWVAMTAEWQRELKALNTPIISMVVTQDNRVLVATQWCVFELKDDKLVLLTFERKLE